MYFVEVYDDDSSASVSKKRYISRLLKRLLTRILGTQQYYIFKIEKVMKIITPFA